MVCTQGDRRSARCPRALPHARAAVQRPRHRSARRVAHRHATRERAAAAAAVPRPRSVRVAAGDGDKRDRDGGRRRLGLRGHPRLSLAGHGALRQPPKVQLAAARSHL
eukprot:6583420-Prymnesium_polylepis.1